VSLRVGRFVTRCAVPSASLLSADTVDGIVRGDLAREIPLALAPHESALGGFHQIRRLPVRVEVTRAELESGRLSEIWSAAIAERLVQALRASPGPAEPDVDSAASREDWIVSALEALVAGRLHRQGRYAELLPLLGRGADRVVLALLLETPVRAAHILSRLHGNGVLDGLLDLLDEPALAEVLEAVAASRPLTRGPTAGDLLDVGDCLIGMGVPPARESLTSSRTAVRVLATSTRSASRIGKPTLPPGIIRQALQGLAALVAREAESSGAPARTAPSETRQSRPGADRLDRIVDVLRRQRVEAAAPPEAAHWVSGRAAGLFLLCDVLEREGWVRVLEEGYDDAFEAARASRFFLMGLALAVLDLLDDDLLDIDPCVSMFAGCEGLPDITGLRRFLVSGDATARRSFVDRLAIDSPAGTADSWRSTLRALATHIVPIFAARLRGFRKASRNFVIERFIAVPGRYRVEDELVTVRLFPHPFHVVLRIAGVDTPTGALGWMHGRRVRIILEGL
jgi:hypothetical protein